MGTAQSCTRAGSAGHEDPFLYREDSRALEQAAREAVDARGLSVPKGPLANALNDSLWPLLSPEGVGQLGGMVIVAPFQMK